MAKTCTVCGKRAYSDYCVAHKPKMPLKRTGIKPRLVQLKRNAPKKTKLGAKKPAESRSKLVRKLDSVFSQYIRLKDAEDGIATCVTSGERKPWKELQNGHFFSRGRYPTRWDEMNCHVQSYRDNVLLKGNYITYTKYMIDRYGREAVDELERKSLSGVKITTPDIREMIEKYTKVVKELHNVV